MIKHWKLALCGVVAYILFLVILTPASWWLKMLTLPPSVQLGPVTGTLWQGEVKQLSFQQQPLPALTWRLNPWSLLTLNPEIALSSGTLQQVSAPYLQSTLQIGFGGLQLEESIVRLPMTTLLPYLTLPLPVQARGDLVVEIQQLRLAELQCEELIGQASWLNASLQPPTGTWLDLKNIYARLSCAAGQPVLITDPENVLSLAIEATMSSTGALRVQGSLLPDPSLPDEVHQAMRFVGQPDANGRFLLNF
ncbi:type II secretion system protein N [Alishewanella tabrizica]|uniref:Type II secretion system protein N n=1 Tax=Alishewanella tabrizica TaxID=671278 RepID=A0ABQ2WRC2_9ALTE|nr:type II secretion system protein N [Alishewanella tabrizica]GGW68615.1 type II secretion protein N [Alishewanella tabrizica]